MLSNMTTSAAESWVFPSNMPQWLLSKLEVCGKNNLKIKAMRAGARESQDF